MYAIPSSSAAPSRYRARLIALAAVILLLAAAVRILGVADRPAWTDEGWTAWAASDHRPAVILDRLAHDRHPPLYTLALSAWWTLAGPSRVALRFLSIAAGLLTVALTYRIGVDWLGRWAAGYAALLLAALPLAVYYAQEIRMYGWLALATTLMTFAFLRYLRRPRALYGALYALSVAFMLYTVYVGVLALAVHGAIGLLLWHGTRRQKLGLIAAWAGALLFFAPWLVVILTQQATYLSEGIGGFPGTIETHLDTLIPVGRIVFGEQLALIGGLYLWALARLSARPRSVRGAAWWTIVLGGAGVLAGMVIGNIWFGVLAPRMLAFLAPLLMLGAGAGFALLDRRLGALLIALWLVVTLADPPVIQPRLASDRAADALAAGYSPGDVIVLETGWDDNAFKYEIERALDELDAGDPRVIRTLPWVDQALPVQTPVLPEIAGTLAEARRVWVVQWLQPSQVIPALDAGEHGFRRVQTIETPVGADYAALYPAHPVVQVVLFERPPQGADALDFGEALALEGGVLPPYALAGARLHVDLWWRAQMALDRDYSAGVYLMRAGSDTVIAQADAAPGDVPTSAWEPDALHFDRHTLALPDDLAPGVYRVAVSVYWFGDGQPLPAAGAPFAVVGQVRVE